MRLVKMQVFPKTHFLCLEYVLFMSRSGFSSSRLFLIGIHKPSLSYFVLRRAFSKARISSSFVAYSFHKYSLLYFDLRRTFSKARISSSFVSVSFLFDQIILERLWKIFSIIFRSEQSIFKGSNKFPFCLVQVSLRLDFS